MLEPAKESNSSLFGPRTLLGVTGAAAVLALTLTPLSQLALRALKPLPGSSAREPFWEPRPLEGNPGLRFDLKDSKPTFQAMADRLPAIEGQPSVESRDEADAPLEPVSRYASLVPAPPELSTESVPLPRVDGSVDGAVEAESPVPPVAEEQRAQPDVATTGSYSDLEAVPPQNQIVERPRVELPRAREPRAQAAPREPKAASRSITDPRPRSPAKPLRLPSQATRDAGQAAHTSKHASTVSTKAVPAPADNKPWTLPRALQPTGL